MERKLFGSYVVFLHEPETEEGKVEYIKTAIDKVVNSMLKAGIIPDWDSLKVIIHEGVDIWNSSPDWYDDEKDDYVPALPRWGMTVGVKFESNQYPEEFKDGGSRILGIERKM